jgi:hypothetical protein
MAKPNSQNRKPLRPTDPSRLRLEWLPGRYAVCRLDAGDSLPDWAGPSLQAFKPPSLLSITRTDRELSVVIDEALVGPGSGLKAERGFAAMRIVGTLDFSLVGVLAGLTGALAAANVPVFVISTFDTDLLLVRAADTDRAARALEAIAAINHPAPSA